MKHLLTLFVLVAATLAATAQDPVRDALQRGLLAEESQRDLKAAAESYAEAVRAADAQRTVHATALFRLAEVQRRLGQTNEARANYLRVVREFGEQSNLVTLARKQVGTPETARVDRTFLNAQITEVRSGVERLRSVESELRDKFDHYRSMDRDRLTDVLAVNEPTPALTALKERRIEAEQRLTQLSTDFGPEHPERRKALVGIKELHELIDHEVVAILSAMESRIQEAHQGVDRQSARLKALEGELEKDRSDSATSLPATGNPRDDQRRLFAEEIDVAQEQLANVRKRVETGQASQDDLLRARREVLALQRQLAAVQPRMDLVDIALPKHFVSVLGLVARPGQVEMPSDHPMDLVEAIAVAGGFSPNAAQGKIRVRRGDVVERHAYGQALTNRVELQPGDLIMVDQSFILGL